MFRTRRFSKLNLIMFTCLIRKHYHEHINQMIYMIYKSSFSRRRNKFRSNLIFHFWAYPNPKSNVACGLCPQPENLDMGPSSHLPQIASSLVLVQSGEVQVLKLRTFGLKKFEIGSIKGITTGPVVPKQETILPSPISIIGNELALILNKKFKVINVEISQKKLMWSKLLQKQLLRQPTLSLK